jgi:lipopolysaccharide/colanic/teichoic acid biosynthesis glycosyltransferase
VYHDTTMRRLERLDPTQSPISPSSGAPAGGASSGRDPRASGGDATRALDIVLAGSLLVFLAPLMLLIALLIWMGDGGWPLFGHRRIGRNGVTFACLKFRSMVPDAEARLERLLATDPVARREWQTDHKLRHDPRITPLGGFLRRSSLDELPQLINVLRGEMSMVGPRPIVESEIRRYGYGFKHYCAVRPGITGLWQVSGRNNLSYRRRVALDRLYVRSRSFNRDIAIMALTVPAVLTRNGSY